MFDEASVSKAIVTQINQKRIYAYKASDRFRKGIPDIYVCGGTWIEDKFFDEVPTCSPRNCMKFFTEKQKLFLARAERSGDNALAGLFFTNRKHNSYFVLIQWRHFICVKAWNELDLKILGERVFPGTPLPILSSLFRNDYPRNFKASVLEHKWNKWLEERDDNFDASGTAGDVDDQ